MQPPEQQGDIKPQGGQAGDELIGKRLGTFEILEEIGRGGMATVYKARQTTINRIVAVKVLPRRLLHDPGFYERFEREVEVVSHLEHPHIVPIYEYGQSDGMPYIAMRYLGGGSLESMIRRHLPELKKLERPLQQIAHALDHAHRQGIIHRDLKPGNIMLDESGNAYLSDFGIARVLGSNMTGSMIVGTPAYMSPEQANGTPLDGRSDIYALGVVLFEILTGREPYQAETPVAILLKHINEPIPSVRDFRPEIPFAIEAIVNQATAKNPNERFPSAGEMIDALSIAIHATDLEYTDATDTITMDAPEAAALQRRTPAASVSPSARTPAAQPPRGTTDIQEAGTFVGKTPTGGQPRPDASTSMHPIVDSPSGEITESSRTTRLTPLVFAGFVLLILVIGGGILLTLINRPQAPVVAIPTAFPRAEVVNSSDYSISMPVDWIGVGGYIDISRDGRQIHLWQADDDSAFVTLTRVEGDGGALDAFAEDQRETTYTGDAYQFIDTATAEDGTIRQSYWLDGSTGFPPGQLDVFYRQQDNRYWIIELYTAHTTGNRFVPSMQLILDSLRVDQS
jgi:eukaryotic-like serine/threonine-protein kinase